jgi:hypothetical protein
MADVNLTTATFRFLTDQSLSGAQKTALLTALGAASQDIVDNYLTPLTPTAGAAISIDFNGKSQAHIDGALSTNATITIANVNDGQTFAIAGQQDGTGGRSVTISSTGWSDVIGDTSSIAEAGANAHFIVTGRRTGASLFVTTTVFE